MFTPATRGFCFLGSKAGTSLYLLSLALALSIHNKLPEKQVGQNNSALCINLNIDVAPITSRTHTHPSHSETSRLLTSSLSLGVPVPRSTQCIRDA
jgi:hypothetical protein